MNLANRWIQWLALSALLLPVSALRAQDIAAPPDDTSDVVVDDRTDRIIQGAIKYISQAQGSNGSWSQGQQQAALTAYPLMAMMADGQLPSEGPYGKTVSRGMQFLLQCVRPDGYIASATGESNMYGHGISTIALAELYGQSHDAAIKPKLERAVKLIINCQNGEGGWRYQPHVSDADISVTVLQVVALRAAKNSGLDVPQATIDKAVAYVRSCCDRATGGFCYQPHKEPGFARTAAAIYSLQVCGLYNDEMVRRGSAYLFHASQREWFSYGNFYAAPAQYMIGGNTWRTWYATVSRTLVNAAKAGPGGTYFWTPLDGGQGVNDVWATSVYTMILAMPYHYIPLYQR